MMADRARQSAVIGSAAIAVAVALLCSGLLGGPAIDRAANRAFGPDATLVAPAPQAFAIRSVIFGGIACYAIWQALPTQAMTERQRRVGYWLVAVFLLEAASILAVRAGVATIGVAVNVILVAVLVTAFAVLLRHPGERTADAVLLDGTVGLLLGWTLVEAMADAAIGASTGGIARGGDIGGNPHLWAIGALAAVAVCGSALAIGDRGRIAPALGSAWGLAWVGVARLDGGLQSPPVAVTAFAAAALILLVAVAVRVARTPVP